MEVHKVKNILKRKLGSEENCEDEGYIFLNPKYGNFTYSCDRFNMCRSLKPSTELKTEKWRFILDMLASDDVYEDPKEMKKLNISYLQGDFLGNGVYYYVFDLYKFLSKCKVMRKMDNSERQRVVNLCNISSSDAICETKSRTNYYHLGFRGLKYIMHAIHSKIDKCVKGNITKEQVKKMYEVISDLDEIDRYIREKICITENHTNVLDGLQHFGWYAYVYTTECYKTASTNISRATSIVFLDF